MMCRAQKRSRGLLPSLAPLLALSIGLVACAPEGATDDPPPDTDPPLTAFLGDPGCDPILPGFAYSQDPGGLPPACALPWPSNLYLKEDPARKTGYTLTFGASSLPHNRQMIPIDPAAYTKRDGYGVGTPILLVIPGLDLTGFATEDHVERSLDKDAPLLLLEDAGGVIRRVPYFVERDALEDSASRQTIFVRPAEILKEATRYVVVLRGLQDPNAKLTGSRENGSGAGRSGRVPSASRLRVCASEHVGEQRMPRSDQ